MFWVVSMICTVNICIGVEPAYSLSFSFYSTKEACEARLGIAKMPDGVQTACVQTDVVTFSPYSGFSANASILVRQ